MNTYSIEGQLIDLHHRRIYPAEIFVSAGKIAEIREIAEAPNRYLLPGFIDAHVHIESSMLSPAAFAQLAVQHGTIATVSDPHEIANVCGVEGINWMIDNAKKVPFKCFFGAPSCVPATAFESTGAVLDAATVKDLLHSEDIWYLSEMMNYPGVLYRDEEVLAKIAAAKKAGKPVDGHAPGLRGEATLQYANAGISTDHECTSLPEAMEKIAAGMHILIREGSAAKNFEALHSLFSVHPEKLMFCSDDKHPDDLATGHINQLVKRALAEGYSLFDVLWAACVNPVLHYALPIGLLKEGDAADFIVLPNLIDFNPSQTYIDGKLVFNNGQVHIEAPKATPINHFKANSCTKASLEIHSQNQTENVKVIVAENGQLTTKSAEATLAVTGGILAPDTSQGILKLVVINRYESNAKPALAFIKGFGFKKGAIASTVAHDCHNIIAVGVEDASIHAAIIAVIEAQGGIAVAHSPHKVSCLPLPIAGLMSDESGMEVGEKYAALSAAAKSLGSALDAPFMTLSFMALLVIPSLKLSDKGLFDGDKFQFCPLIH